jgi:ActR/RegA family two-component response regulator
VATSRIVKRPRLLVAHPDGAWVARARGALEALGYAVTDCLDLSLAADLVAGTRPFDLAAVSNELDPDSQLRILKHLKQPGVSTRIMLLLDSLDSATSTVRRGPVLTHRVSEDVDAFVQAVAAAAGPAPRPPAV